MFLKFKKSQNLDSAQIKALQNQEDRMRIVPYCDPECVKVHKECESFLSFNKLHLLFEQVMCILVLQILWLTLCQSCILLLLPSPYWWQLQCMLKSLKQFQHTTWLNPDSQN